MGIWFSTSPPLGEAGRSSYDVQMAQRSKFVWPVLAILLVTLLFGCKARPKSSTVTVHLLRDLRSAYGSELDRRILDFQGTNPRLASGAPITIVSETGDYKDLLSRQTANADNVDLIILNSSDDVQGSVALQAALAQATNVCAGLKACPTAIPAIIPQQIAANEREAAQKFVDFLQKAPS